MLQNTKSKGFTLVELLIVIVVIAILAAISIVAYNGIQNRGKNTSAQSLASQVVKKAEAYNTIESRYPVSVAEMNALTESELNGLTVVPGTPADEGEVQMVGCPAGATASNITGVRINYQTFPMNGTSSLESMVAGTC